MCPSNFLMLLAVVGAFCLLIYSYHRQIQNAHSNRSMIEPLLQASVTKPRFFGIHFDLEGSYQGRRVGYFYRMSSERSNSDYNIWIEPKVALPKQGWFLVDYPRPTPHTRLVKGKIFYHKRSFSQGGLFNPGNLLLLTPEETREILEELTQAAGLVEAGQPGRS